MPELTLNGQPLLLPTALNLAQALQQWRPEGPVAVAINGKFIPRSHYDHTLLADGDAVELLTPVAGG